MKRLLKMRFLLPIGLILLLAQTTIAQENPKLDKETIYANASNSVTAKKVVAIAEKYYKKGPGVYDEALKYYLRLYEKTKVDTALNYKIGVCYLWSSNKASALSFLLESTPATAKDYYLALGKAYQYNLKYPEAKEAYENFYNTLRKSKKRENKGLLDQLKKDCDFGEIAIQNPTPVFINHLGPLVNSYYDDYGAFIAPWDSLMYLTSKRPEREPTKRVSRFKYHERVLTTNNCINEPASFIQSVSKLDGSVNNSIAGFNAKRDLIYYYKGESHNGAIHAATIKNGKAKKRTRLKGPINHIAYKETSISVADDGTTYFVSTRRKDNRGGKDIYVCNEKGKYRFKKVENLGTNVNTPFDEECVQVTPDGNTLYFSSKGHGGMGGFDVFKTVRKDDGSWSDPINLGYPINTPADELFYRPTGDPLVALYSSIREGSLGGLDIFKIKVDTRIPFTLSGMVTDIESNDTLQATVNAFDYETNTQISAALVDTISGLYNLSFEDIGSYSLQVDAPGYAVVTDTIINPSERNAELVMDFQLMKLKHPFTISGIVTDTITHVPLSAEINFYNAEADTFLVRQVTSAETGRYAVTLDDKYKLRMEVSASDYFAYTDSTDTRHMSESELSKSYLLRSTIKEYNLHGIVFEEGTTDPVAARLFISRINESLPFASYTTDSTGIYSFKVEENGEFLIDVKSEGYFFKNDTCLIEAAERLLAYDDTIKQGINGLLVKRDINLKKIKKGVTMVVDNILFNSGKSTLKPESFPSLDKLADLLLENKNVRIEVSGHTDNVGSASINKRISKARALSVRNYILSTGVEMERVTYEGYGFDQPIATNVTQEGRAQNRRVEIKILDDVQ